MAFEKGQSGNPNAQFQPGQSGNPAGKAPGTRNRSTLIRKWLDTPMKFKDPSTGEQVEGTLEDMMVLGQISAATNGGPQFKELMDSVYGKQESKLEVTAPKKTVIRIGAPAPQSPDGSD